MKGKGRHIILQTGFPAKWNLWGLHIRLKQSTTFSLVVAQEYKSYFEYVLSLNQER